jgi:hypothetical protein
MKEINIGSDASEESYQRFEDFLFFMDDRLAELKILIQRVENPDLPPRDESWESLDTLERFCGLVLNQEVTIDFDHEQLATLL